MAQQRPTTQRLASFSDAVFAVIITIMVLELKLPEDPTFAGLRPLWPTALSYLVSYYFIAIVWLNVFVLVNLAYIPFEWHALSAAPIEEISLRSRRFAKVRSGARLGTFVLAMLVSLQSPYWGFGLVCCALLSTCGQSYRGLCKRQMYRF